MRRWTFIVLASIAAVVAVWLLFFRDSDEEAVRRTVRRAADAVKVIPGENPVMRAARVRSELVEVIAPDVATTIPDLGDATKGRDALVGAAISAAGAYERAEIAVSFSGVKLDGASAAVEVTATLTGTRAGAAERDVRRCSVRLLKRDGAFRITEIIVYPRSES